MIRLNQIKLNINDIDIYSFNKNNIKNILNENRLLNKRVKALIKTDDYIIEKLVRLSVDARDKSKLQYILSIDISSPDEKNIIKKNVNNNNIMLTNEPKYKIPLYDLNGLSIISPIIIGSGPAGYFAGLYLARMGFKPVIFERGKEVSERIKDVEGFWEGKSINPESNVSFGEGGAGTFSDGKLNTGVKDKTGRIKAVIDDFINFGAPFDIGFQAKPHIGTNELRKVMANMRNEIITLGGQVVFNSKFTGFVNKNDNVSKSTGNLLSVEITSMLDGKKSYYDTNALILAIGHSARDTFEVLKDNELNMEPKPFAIGLRIEHQAEMINRAQYGKTDFNNLPTADYKMTYHSSNGRNVYSFCMCPGGYVVNASSDKEQSVVNGMSNHNRNGKNSNSAIVCNVIPEDFAAEGFEKYGVLSGVYFQKKFESAAFKEGNGKIPVQLFKDYKDNKTSVQTGKILPEIKGNYSFGNLNNCLPSYVNNAIIEAIDDYGRKLKGFNDGDAILSGVETRTSSPVKILRDEFFMSNIKGIFPCGEGAGYAGGITSAAVDGIKVAEATAGYLYDLYKK